MSSSYEDAQFSEICDLHREIEKEESRTVSCQKEIRRLRAAVRELEAEREKIYQAGFYDGECYYAGRDVTGPLPAGSFYFHRSWGKEE